MNQQRLFYDPVPNYPRADTPSLICDLLRQAEQNLQQATDGLYKLNATGDEVHHCLASVDRALTQCRQRQAQLRGPR